MTRRKISKLKESPPTYPGFCKGSFATGFSLWQKEQPTTWALAQHFP